MGNPIVTDVYTSDPAVLVHDGTVYVYTGHDEAPPAVDDYVMRDWLSFSSTDLLTWQPHGPFRDALGTALVTNDVPFDTDFDHTIDPSVIIQTGCCPAAARTGGRCASTGSRTPTTAG